jgi:hypothetical protein
LNSVHFGETIAPDTASGTDLRSSSEQLRDYEKEMDKSEVIQAIVDARDYSKICFIPTIRSAGCAFDRLSGSLRPRAARRNGSSSTPQHARQVTSENRESRLMDAFPPGVERIRKSTQRPLDAAYFHRKT